MKDRKVILDEKEANKILRLLGNNLDDLTNLYNKIGCQLPENEFVG
jgi:hypothetical protein